MISPFSQILGHKAQTDYLARVLENGNTAHAYCFSGPEHVGKTLVAERFLSPMLGDAGGSLHSQAEVSEVRRPMDPKTGERKNTIPAESIRELRDRLQMSSFSTARKIAIIYEADCMTTTAQNALLKILEEPVGDTIIVLLASQPDRLLPTILSRVVHLSFLLVPREDICAELRKTMDAELAHTIAGLASGRPGTAFVLAGKDAREAKLEELRDTLAFLSGTLTDRFRETESLQKDREDRDCLTRVLANARQVLHDCLLVSASCEHLLAASVFDGEVHTLAAKKSAGEWAKILTVLGNVERAIQNNGNIGVSLEEFALSL